MSRANLSLLFTLTIILVAAWAFFTIAVAQGPGQFGGDLNKVSVRVIDGDTFVLNEDLVGEIIVRVWGIDAPERGQPLYSEAKESLETLLEDGHLQCTKISTSYNRIVAQCSVSNQDIGYFLLWEGLAFHDTRFTKGTTASWMTIVQTAAKLAGRGVWARRDVIYPWDYRKGVR